MIDRISINQGLAIKRLEQKTRDINTHRNYLDALVKSSRAVVENYFTPSRSFSGTTYSPDVDPTKVLSEIWKMIDDLNTDMSRELDKLMMNLESLKDEIRA